MDPPFCLIVAHALCLCAFSYNIDDVDDDLYGEPTDDGVNYELIFSLHKQTSHFGSYIRRIFISPYQLSSHIQYKHVMHFVCKPTISIADIRLYESKKKRKVFSLNER